MKNKIMVLTRDQSDYKKAIEKINFPDSKIFIPKNEEEIYEYIGEIDIILGTPPVSAKYIHLAKNLKWHQSTFAGVDMLIEQKDKKSDYILTNVKDTYGKDMSEYIFGYILMFQKEILKNIEHNKNHNWSQRIQPTIQNQIIAIMGTGSIGKEIAKTAKHFGMKTIGLRTQNKPVEYFDEIYTFKNIKTFLEQADYVVGVLPNTTDTFEIMNQNTFGYMKSSSVYINVGRGNNVNEDDLIKALNQKQIAYAVLDVFKQEPLPKENPLWDTKNLFISPHMSGYIESLDTVIKIFQSNYNKFISGEELDYQIDFNKGY